MKYNLHTHQYNEHPEVIEIVNQYPQTFNATIPFYSIGIHPWHINTNTIPTDLSIINHKLKEPNCLALGECGLDKRIDIDIKIQIEIFEKQLLLAQKHKKPVILHCVSAFQEIIAIKKQLQIEEPMIIHGFSKNIQVAQRLIDQGFYLSFGKYLLRNPNLAQVFKAIPNNKIFLETDTMQETIFEVYKKASEIKNTTMEHLIEANYKKVFNVK